MFEMRPKGSIGFDADNSSVLACGVCQEAFGNVVLEALASGLPVVTIPEVGAVEEIEGELKEGILIDPDDLKELKMKILRLLDKDRWPSLSTAARQVA